MSHDSLSGIAQRVAKYIATTPGPESGAAFDDLARTLFAAQFSHNSAYAAYARSLGQTSGFIGRWEDIPFIPTSAFKDCELTSLAPNERARVFFSSATTGQGRSRHFHHHESMALYEASLSGPFHRFLIEPRTCVEGLATDVRPALLSLTPAADAAPNSSLVHMLDYAAKAYCSDRSVFAGRLGPESLWPIDFDLVLDALDQSAASKSPLLLTGTAFNFVELLDFLAAKNRRVRLPLGSRIMETGGYKGRTREMPREELVKLLVEFLGANADGVVSEYGMSELSSQAYETRDSSGTTQGYVFPHWVRTRIVSPETGHEQPAGKPGLLQILDLANVWSVAAIQTGDLAVGMGDRFRLFGRAPKTEVRGCSLMTA